MSFTRPQFEVADIFRQYGNRYRAGKAVPVAHQKVMSAITQCRTAELGGHKELCGSCGYERISYNSCRNRHCPKCQFLRKEQWIEDRKSELLPVPYYHLVFTLPSELNGLCLHSPRIMYGLLFKAAWQTLRTLAEDRKYLGAKGGMIAVLHTWGQNLSLHPHLHCIVPGGGLSTEGFNWIAAKGRSRYLFPVKRMSRLFRGKYLAVLRKELPESLTRTTTHRACITSLYEKEWIVFAKKPFAGPEQVINYLGRYTHRIAISNHRLISISDKKVSFQWKNYRTGQTQPLTLAASEFIRRFLQHVLPNRLQKIRHYGILSNRNKTERLNRIRALFNLPAGVKKKVDPLERIIELCGSDPTICPACRKGVLMRIAEQYQNRGSP